MVKFMRQPEAKMHRVPAFNRLCPQFGRFGCNCTRHLRSQCLQLAVRIGLAIKLLDLSPEAAHTILPGGTKEQLCCLIKQVAKAVGANSKIHGV